MPTLRLHAGPRHNRKRKRLVTRDGHTLFQASTVPLGLELGVAITSLLLPFLSLYTFLLETQQVVILCLHSQDALWLPIARSIGLSLLSLLFEERSLP